MHTHTVFFWLWKTTSQAQRAEFRKGLQHLLKDPNVRHATIGEPAKTDRDVVDNSYDFGVVAVFDSLEAHNAYQVGRHHEEFLQMCQDLWSRVQVYDLQH